QALTEPAQTSERSLLALVVEVAVGIQARGEPDHLPQPVHDDRRPVLRAGDDHVEAVRAEIDGRHDLRGRGGGSVTAFGQYGRGVASDRERRAATAGRRRVWIADDELRARQILAIVDLGAGQVLDAQRVDEQRHAALRDRGVPLLDLLVEREPVLEAGAAAAL